MAYPGVSSSLAASDIIIFVKFIRLPGFSRISPDYPVAGKTTER